MRCKRRRREPWDPVPFKYKNRLRDDLYIFYQAGGNSLRASRLIPIRTIEWNTYGFAKSEPGFGLWVGTDSANPHNYDQGTAFVVNPFAAPGEFSSVAAIFLSNVELKNHDLTINCIHH